METSNIPQVKNSLNISRYTGKVAGVIRAIFGRRTGAGARSKNRAVQEACARCEHYQAQSMAQVQSTKFLR
jgi:hypothetical protein